MAGKKGIIPTHVKKKHFVHPGIESQLIQQLEQVEDPRKPSLFLRYSLTSILFMTITAVMCGATDWPKVIVISQGLAEWLAKYIDMSSGVPCERTFVNLMNTLRPEALELVLSELSSLIRKKTPREVVSFDGQTAKGTADKRLDISGLHLISAWSTANGICLAQLKVDDMSNEITAISKLIELLDLKGTIITADALNTQKAIVAKAIEVGADYLFPVKGNQPKLLQEVTSAFEAVEAEQQQARATWERAVTKAREHRDKPRLEELIAKGPSLCGASIWKSEPEKAHGRIETRGCVTISAKDLPSKDEWKAITSIARVDRERAMGDKVERETVYYISSLSQEADIIGAATREHWGVENGLHWRLDVIFRQDNSRYRDRIGARNLAAIRKIVLNALLKETTLKKGAATKQCAAACNPTYREKLLKILF